MVDSIQKTKQEIILKDYEDLQKTSSNWPPSFKKKQWGSQEDGLRMEEQTSYMKMSKKSSGAFSKLEFFCIFYLASCPMMSILHK